MPNMKKGVIQPPYLSSIFTTAFLTFSNETIGNGCISVAKRCNRQRFLTCCCVLTSCVLCYTKPLRIDFRLRFKKRGREKPLPIDFMPRFGMRGHKKPLPIPFRLRFENCGQ
ncbi:hypothetical protein QL285_097267 [Trifolium repens]|nr:hypothetical protein QL285_097267 [Trifolium repens]